MPVETVEEALRDFQGYGDILLDSQTADVVMSKKDKPAPRLNVNLSDSNYKELKRYAEAAHLDISDFVRHAIRFLITIQDERAKGAKVFVGNKKNLQEVMLLIDAK